jgi:membrane associated rhomboid family serine protease
VHVLSLLAPRAAWRLVCLSPKLVVRLQIWRVVTAPLWHSGTLHLALNVAALLALAPDLERSMGSVRVRALLALIGGVGGGWVEEQAHTNAGSVLSHHTSHHKTNNNNQTTPNPPKH